MRERLLTCLKLSLHFTDLQNRDLSSGHFTESSALSSCLSFGRSRCRPQPPAACTWEEIHLEPINFNVFFFFPQLRGVLGASPILTPGFGDSCGSPKICTLLETRLGDTSVAHSGRIWWWEMPGYCREGNTHLILLLGMKPWPYQHTRLTSKVQPSGKRCFGRILSNGGLHSWVVWKFECSWNYPTERALSMHSFLIANASIWSNKVETASRETSFSSHVKLAVKGFSV